MRVISNRLLDLWPREIICKRCESVLEVELEDISGGWFGANYGGDSPDYHIHVECPVCGNNIFISEDIVPKDKRVALATAAGHRDPDQA